jgi:hypothetical protein
VTNTKRHPFGRRSHSVRSQITTKACGRSTSLRCDRKEQVIVIKTRIARRKIQFHEQSIRLRASQFTVKLGPANNYSIATTADNNWRGITNSEKMCRRLQLRVDLEIRPTCPKIRPSAFIVSVSATTSSWHRAASVGFSALSRVEADASGLHSRAWHRRSGE